MLATRLGGVFLLLSFSLCGCSIGAPGSDAVGDGSIKKQSARQTPSGPLDFAWKLSGDRAVAPLQVFSDPSHTWLQWLPNQTLPAIFAVTESGEQLASYERVGPYAKLQGNWSALIFRGAHLQARARRVHAIPATASDPLSIGQQRAKPSVVTPTLTSTSVSVPVPAQPGTQPFYAITSADKNLRQALARWSGLSGWRFQAEHWAVDVDIPLTATANFSDDFMGSVRALVEATELSERPLQPCFYANQVLRVVSINEVCDRTVVEGARV